MSNWRDPGRCTGIYFQHPSSRQVISFSLLTTERHLWYRPQEWCNWTVTQHPSTVQKWHKILQNILMLFNYHTRWQHSVSTLICATEVPLHLSTCSVESIYTLNQSRYWLKDRFWIFLTTAKLSNFGGWVRIKLPGVKQQSGLLAYIYMYA